jgi:hypothetical protein
MVEPFGILILIGFVARRLLNTGHERLTYVSVQAESAVNRGGPVEGVVCKLANLWATAWTGSPRSYAGLARR